MNDALTLWSRFQSEYRFFPSLNLAVDLSRVDYPQAWLDGIRPKLARAFKAMDRLERGQTVNVDEGRMVGHYWLRAPELAPCSDLTREIQDTLARIKSFAADLHESRRCGAGGRFENLLVVGIGGSALGPQFVAKALGHPARDKMAVYFFDNTDPDGMDFVLAQLAGKLDRTLCVVISKSGGTKETRNGMVEAEAAYKAAGLSFAAHAVAITMAGSDLEKHAIAQGWMDRFPMWDWVGGRTSETSAVGLLPAALQGLDIDQFIAGAKACDAATRTQAFETNPAAQLALMWHFLTDGKGAKDMVVIPYKDRLELFSKYLQQLVMESLGKEFDLADNVVNQGLSVYGNKGSTDQHAYVQQLREGVLNFFVLFIEVLRDRDGASMEVERGATSGDFLNGFLLGTRQALHENGRQSITLTVGEMSAFTVGVLIALFERAVGLYAALIGINAYHQPGVEAGKKAAGEVLKLQHQILANVTANPGAARTAQEIAQALGAPQAAETVFKICRHLSSNPSRGIVCATGGTPSDARFVAG